MKLRYALSVAMLLSVILTTACGTITQTMRVDPTITLEVPGFVGATYDKNLELQLELSGNYNVTVVYEYIDYVERDQIIAQDPLEGEKRKIIPGENRCDLILTVSKGAQPEVEIKQNEQERDENGELRDFTNDHVLLPSIAIDKIISVTNIGENPAYVRTWFAFESGELSVDEFEDMIIINKNTSQWTFSGFVPETINTSGGQVNFMVCAAVYNCVLEPGQTTEPSLVQFTLSPMCEQ